MSANSRTTAAVTLSPMRMRGLASPLGGAGGAGGAAAVVRSPGFAAASMRVGPSAFVDSFRAEDVVQLETMCQVEYILARRAKECDQTAAHGGIRVAAATP